MSQDSKTHLEAVVNGMGGEIPRPRRAKWPHHFGMRQDFDDTYPVPYKVEPGEMPDLEPRYSYNPWPYRLTVFGILVAIGGVLLLLRAR